MAAKKTADISDGKHQRRDHLEDVSIDGRIITTLVLKLRYKDLHWIHLAQDMVQ
jgi:hypothetical protein